MTEKLILEAPRKAMAALLALTIALGPTAMPAFAASKPGQKAPARVFATTTPIQHIVVIMQENRSFDNLFNGFPGADTVQSGMSAGTRVKC